MRLIDWHVHLLPPQLRGSLPPELLRHETEHLRSAYRHPRVDEITKRASEDAIFEMMTSSGVDISVCFGHQWRAPELCEENNRYVVDTVAKSDGRLRGLVVGQPRDPGSLERIDEHLSRPGILGVKVKPKWGGFSLADARTLAPLVEIIQAHDAILLTHVTQAFHPSAGDSVSDLIAMLRAFPSLRVVAAHLGGFVDVYRCHPPIGSLLDNLWIDVSLPSNIEWLPELMSRGAGSRYLYATDFPYAEADQFLGAPAFGARDPETGLSVLDALRRNGEELLRAVGS